jgi:uncharacterized protein (DUF2141 family)
MKKLILTSILLVGMITVVMCQTTASKGILTVKLIGFRSDHGQVCVSLFNKSKGFPGKYDQAFKIVRSPIIGKQATVAITDLPYGTYAVSVLHDENSNNKMDTNIIGIPREGFGSSNNPKERFGPPTFDDARFDLKSPSKSIEINIKYF